MNLKRRIPQYLLGLLLMAIGVVCTKRSCLGLAPISSAPAALANILPFTLGNMTIVFHVFCLLLQLLVQRRVTLKALLTLPVAIPFGYLIDLFMWLFQPPALALAVRYLLQITGAAVSAFGIVLIVGADLMLPAPDAFTRVLSLAVQKPLGKVKFAVDAAWVVVGAGIELLFHGGVIESVGIGTLISVLCMGPCVSFYNRVFPGLAMPPLQRPAKAEAE